MEYTALYRKFRPTRFDEVVGQEHIVKTLKNEIMNNRIGHAYLFNGGRGTGKTSCAKIFSRAVNCLNPKDGEPCNECEICKAALEGSLTDIVEMDAASNNSVDDIRAIRDEVNFLPTLAKYRVYIIDEVHMLSTGAFNALLKTLEEPPAHVKFILATTEPQKLPTTILSRCQRFDFKKISASNIEKRLDYVCSESKIDITDEANKIIAILAEGAMRDALSILERCMQEEGQITEELVKELVGIPKIESINKLTQSIVNKNVEEAMQCINEVVGEGKDISNYLWEVIKYIKDLLILKTGTNLEIYSENEILQMKELSQKISKERLIKIIFELSNLQNEMKWSSQKLIMFQVGIIKLCSQEEEKTEISENYENNKPNNSKEIENLNYKINRLEKQLTNIQSGKEFSTTSTQTVEKTPAFAPKAEVKKIESVELGEKVPNWQNIINGIKADGKISLYTNLLNSEAHSINDMTVGIKFEKGLTSFGKRIIEMPENMSEITKQVSLEMGKTMRVVLLDNNNEIASASSNLEEITNGINMKINILD